MKVVFKKHLEREDQNFDEEKRKLNKLLTQVAKTIAIEKRGLKGKGYYYIYYTNPLNHKNYKGNTYIFDYELRESYVQLKLLFIGKRSSLFNIGNIFSEFEWDWAKSSDNTASLSFVPNLNPNVPLNQLQRASVEFTVYEYHTSAPSEWGLKWFEELRPCYSYTEEDGDEGYYTKYDINSLPVLGDEELRQDTEKCAIIYDHLHHRPRAVVRYNNVYDTENPPWWVEEQLR
jgi:hypothetical protein